MQRTWPTFPRLCARLCALISTRRGGGRGPAPARRAFPPRPQARPHYRSPWRKLTLATHAHLKALSQSAILALVPVVLVNGTLSASSAAVGEVPSD